MNFRDSTQVSRLSGQVSSSVGTSQWFEKKTKTILILYASNKQYKNVIKNNSIITMRKSITEINITKDELSTLKSIKHH